MVHQHPLRDTAIAEHALQLLPDQLPARAPSLLQQQQITAVVVDHRQRTGRRIPTLRALEVHLPQLVGTGAFKALSRYIVPVRRMDQIVPQQNAMNRAAGQYHPLALQQNSQLARTPVRIAAAQLDHPLLQFPQP